MYLALIKKFKKKLWKEDGRTLLWFQRTYLPKIRYNYFIVQINGHSLKIDDDIITAIEKYLEDK